MLKNTKYPIFSFILCLLSLLSNYLHAQGEDLKFKQISVEQGLSQSIVQCILQDSLGFMWFGTEGGLNKYDGFNFTIYKPHPFDTTSISDSDILYIYEAPSEPEVIWVGTKNGGLNRLDRKTEKFTHFKNIPRDSTSLGHNLVGYIYEDSHTDFWVLTADGGLDRLNRETGKFTRFRYDPNNPNSISHNIIKVFYEDSFGVIWLGTQAGLNKFDREENRFSRYAHDPLNPNSLSFDYITSILQSSAEPEILWIGTGDPRTLEGGGLNRYDMNLSEFKHYKHDSKNPKSISSNLISRIHEDKNGYLWIGSWGLNKFDPKTGLFTTYLPDPENPTSMMNFIVYLYEDSKGYLWLQTWPEDDGLHRFDPIAEKFTHYRHDANNPHSLSVNEVITFYEDRTGVMWFGTDVGGVNKLDLSGSKFYTQTMNPHNPNSLSNHIVRSIWEDQSGMLWVGVADSGLNKINRETGKVTHYFPDPENINSLGDDDVWSIFEDHSGILWLGTHRGGLNRFDPVQESFTHYLHDENNPNSLSHNIIWAIYESPREPGVLWIGTEGGGINRFDTEKEVFKRYQHNPNDQQSLSHNYTRVIYEDSAGDLWFGTFGGGLNRFDRVTEKFEVFRHDPQNSNSLSTDNIQAIYGDRSGILWIGTYGGGLNRFDTKTETVTIFTEQNSDLCNNVVYGILEDGQRNLWISTNNGLSRFNPQENTFYTYTQDDGLQSNEFNGSATFKSRSGEMFFGGIDGFSSFYPDKLQHNEFLPQIALTGFTLYGQSVKIGGDSPLRSHINETKEINLDYWQNDISIEYAALHFSNPANNRYAYKLENYEDHWRQVGIERSATYTNLDPGEYTFRVKASNSDGLWNEKDTNVRIVISPPFWQTWWFRCLAILIGLFTAVSLYRKRINHVEKRKRELEIQVDEKTKAASALQNALSEVERLKNRLEAENVYLQSEIKLEHNFSNIISQSASFKKVLSSVEQVASTDATVLILGESGTGKELIARAIHNISSRSNRPLVKVNCAAIPANLIESELFGHEKGAFTGAISKKEGRFELANGGTLFLDEIGDLPFELQAKLLRVLQDGEYERLGGNKTLKVDVRVIAATNRNLESEIEDGRFREDLFYRLNVFPIKVIPLRERKDDIPLLVNHFVDKYSSKIGKKIQNIPQGVIDRLFDYNWPGNIRELENIIERSIIISSNKKLVLGDWFQKDDGLNNNHSEIQTLETLERQHIIKALEKTGWRVSGEKGAAKILGLKSTTLDARMRKLNIKRNRGF